MINLTSNGIANGEGPKKSTIDRKIKIGPLSINFITIIIVALITLFYLAQTQVGTAKRSQIQELQKEKQEIERELELLGVDVAKLKSIRNIESELENLNMVPTQQINYIIEKSSDVAKKSTN